MNGRFCFAVVLVAWGGADDAHAEPAAPASVEIVVTARSEKRIGTATAASEGAVSGADIAVRPLLRPGELLESVPGLIATQHSGGGKANQYFLRGFNLDHGTDFGTSIDDMPMNFRTHGHGQGYLDVNGLIPETVARVDYRKGPYRADAGDFTFVGQARISTLDTVRPFAALEYGGYGYRRAVVGGSLSLAGGDLVAVGQYKTNEGPWDLPEKFRGAVGFLKFSRDVGTARLFASASVYHATWQPTEQLPERAVGTLVNDRFGTLDRFLTGRTDRQILTLGLSGEDWRITAWLQHYDWSLLSNFTFYLDDPVNGDEVRQYEQMWGFGGRAEKSWSVAKSLTITTGAETRIDDIGTVGLDHSIKGVTDDTKNRFAVRETSGALYAEATWKPLDGLMIVGGLRGDTYRFATHALAGAAWSGSTTASIASPKLGLNYRVAPGFAIYANYGDGFHSNDARGVTAPVTPAPGLVKGDFKELGLRIERGTLVVTADYWWSRIASELIYVGDSGAVEPTGAGRRQGYELTAFWKPLRWLQIDAVWTAASSHYADLPDGQNHIPGSLENSGEIGVAAIFSDWNASLRIRHLGPHPLVEDNSERGESTTLVNLRAAYMPGKFELSVELLNALNSKSDDIDYFYATRLPGEPSDGIEGRNSRIVEPRQVRLGIKYRF